MILVGRHKKASVLACHYPEVVVIVAGSGMEGVISSRNFDKVAALYDVNLIDISLFGVHSLNTEAFGLFELIVVYFLGSRLCGHIVVIVLMRRIACPLTALDVCFADIEYIRLDVLGQG